MAAQVIQGFVFERASTLLLARVENPDGDLVTRASLASISRQIHKVSVTPPVPVGSEVTETIADVVFDTLQTDDRWTLDSLGYNFAAELSKTDLPENGVYRVEYELVTVAGSKRYWVIFEITAHEVQFSD